jgi:EpsI family protein
MNTLRIRALVVLALMLASVAGAAAWRPTTKLADSKPKLVLETMFPSQFGEWVVDTRGPVQLVSPDQKALLDKLYNQTLSRVYVNRRGDRVMLSVAYGGDQSDGTRAHRPDVCYPAQGFDIVSRAKGQVSLGSSQLPVLHMTARLGARTEPVTYWFVIGERVALSGTQQKLAQLSYSTRGIVPDGLLMRVSTIDTNSDRAYRLQAQFVADLHQAVPAVSRSQLFGLAESHQPVAMLGQPAHGDTAAH